MASVLAGARAHVHHEVGRPDGVLVVLHDHHGVAQVSQALQRGDEPLVVALVKPDGGLVQNVEHAHEPGADLGGEPDALGLCARPISLASFRRCASPPESVAVARSSVR